MEEKVEDHSDVWVFNKQRQEWVICKVVEDNVDEGVMTIIDESPKMTPSSSSASFRNVYNASIADDHIKGQPQVVNKADICVVDPTHLQDLDDLSAMNNLHEAPLINILRKRWYDNRIYTAASDVLISVNPYKTIPGIYDNPSHYFNFPLPGVEFNEDEYLQSVAEMSPHVYLVANRSLRSLLAPELTPGQPANQSVIISGESGAGKTEASKHVVNFLIHANQQFAKSMSFRINTSSFSSSSINMSASFLMDKIGIKNLILESSVIFEAFGNAKTVRNDNSSRFGKYIKLQYSSSYELVSAATETFLLEKSRLVNVGENERNYHVFYQMLRGLKDMDALLYDKIGLDDISNFKILTMGNCVIANEMVDDGMEFRSLYQALQSIHTSSELLTSLWMILASILHLGNASVHEPSSYGGMCSIQLSSTSIVLLASMLGVEDDVLIKALVSATFRSGRATRGSIHVKTLSVMESMNNINALMKWLYYQVFMWLVNTINNAHKNMNLSSSHDDDDHQHHDDDLKFIGILDIFGFEILINNSFEQLCINYTNERLQQQFNEYVFLSEQDLYRLEGLDWTSISYKDNQHIIDLIAKKPVGMLLVLEEHGMMNRAPDDNALLHSINQHHDKHEAYMKSKFAGEGFAIKHFAGMVQYKITGFLNKNNNSLQDDLNILLSTSKNLMLRQIMDASYGSSSSLSSMTSSSSSSSSTSSSSNVMKKMSSSVTVSLQFRGQLDTLIKTLRDTHPHYIKCIKPNDSKDSRIFDWSLVATQLRYSGALEVVRIRREGYPIRLSYHDFYIKYYYTTTYIFQRLYPSWKKHPHDDHHDEVMMMSNDELRSSCSVMLSLCLSDDDYQVGNTMIFLREHGFIDMQKAIKRLYRSYAIIIQSWYRSHHLHSRYIMMKYHMIIIQSYGRRYLAYRRYHRFYRAVCIIQASYKYKIWSRMMMKSYMIYRVEYDKKMKMIHAQVRISSYYRMRHHRHQYHMIKKMIISMQSIARGIITRHHLHIQRNAGSIVQHYVSKHYRGMMIRKTYHHMRSCIIIIQSYMRRFLAQKLLDGLKAAHRLKCAIKIQLFLSSKYRSYIAQASYHRSIHHIIMIQAMIRRHHAYKILNRLKLDHIYDRMTYVQLRLSSLYHMIKQRRSYYRMISYIIIIQSLIRRWKAKKILSSYMHQRQHVAAMMIQIFTSSHYHGRKMMRRYHHIRSSIIIIQTSYRRYDARKQLIKLRHDHHQVMLIQACYRRFRSYRSYHIIRHHIIIIQTIYRCKIHHHRYLLMRLASIIIQRHIRGYHARMMIYKMIWLIITLQKYIRMKIISKRYHVQVSSYRMIQRVGRGTIARRHVHHMHDSIIMIQSIIRMHHAMTSYNEKLFYIISLQAYIRQVITRCRYHHIRHHIIIIQAYMRRFHHMRRYHHHRHMIIMIQSYARTWNMMRQYQTTLYHIITIQTHIRKTLSVIRYHHIRDDIMMIQSCIRMFIAKRRYAYMMRCVIKIQSIGRSYNQRKIYDHQLYHIIILQSNIRRYVCLSSYHHHRQACIRIQTYIRCRFVRYAYQYMRTCAIKICSIARTFLAKLQLKYLRYLHRQASCLIRFFRSLYRKLKLYHFQDVLYTSLRDIMPISHMIISCPYMNDMKKIRNKWRQYETVYHAACQSDRKDNLILLHATPYDMMEYDATGGTCLHAAMRRMVDMDVIYEIFNILDVFRYVPPSLSNATGDDAIVFADGDSDDGKDGNDDNDDNKGSNNTSLLFSSSSKGIAAIDTSSSTSKVKRSSVIMSNIAEFVPSSPTASSSDTQMMITGRQDSSSSINNPINTSDLTIIRQGYLKKKSENLGFWQKRWFILTDTCLQYYGTSNKPKNLDKPRMKITLDGCLINRVMAGGKQAQPIIEITIPNATEKRNFFGKIIQKKSFLFQACDEKDLQDWLCPVKAVAGMVSFRETAVKFIQLDLHELYVNIVNHRHETPLHVLLKSYHKHTSYNNKHDHSSNKGSMVYELRKRVLILASWCIDKGCNLDARDHDGYSIIDLCRIYQYKELLHYIEGIKLYHSIRRQFHRLRGYSYLNIFYGSMRMNINTSLSNTSNAINYASCIQPRLKISIYNQKRQVIEDAVDIGLPAVQESSEFWWGTSWFMQTPLENIQPDNIIITEFFEQPGILTAWNRFDFNTETIDSDSINMPLRKPPMLWDGAGSTQANHAHVIGMINVRIMISRKIKSYTIDDVKRQQIQSINQELESTSSHPIEYHKPRFNQYTIASSYKAKLSQDDMMMEDMMKEMQKKQRRQSSSRSSSMNLSKPKTALEPALEELKPKANDMYSTPVRKTVKMVEPVGNVVPQWKAPPLPPPMSQTTSTFINAAPVSKTASSFINAAPIPKTASAVNAAPMAPTKKRYV